MEKLYGTTCKALSSVMKYSTFIHLVTGCLLIGFTIISSFPCQPRPNESYVHMSRLGMDIVQTIHISCADSSEVPSSADTENVFIRCLEVILENCSWSKHSFARVMRHLGHQNIATLDIQYAVNGDDVFTGSYFQGLSSLMELTIRNSEIPHLPDDVFEGLPQNLSALHLSHNHLNAVQAELFKPIFKVQWLTLDGNNLRHLPGGAFQHLRSLDFCSLSSNKLQTLTRGVFADVPNLSTLLLGDNEITSLSEDVFYELKVLKYLRLRDNNIRHFHDKLFANNGQLIRLDVENASGTNVTTLPSNFFKNLIFLQKVSMAKNDFLDLSDVLFHDAANLVNLDLGHNKLISLNDVIFLKNKKLEELYLHDNELQFLHRYTFKSLGALTTLRLENNQLTTLDPDIFSTLVDLTSISLANNRVNMSGTHNNFSNLKNCTKIRHICLSNNTVPQIYHDWRFNDKYLELLDLSFNPIQYTENEITFISAIDVFLGTTDLHGVNSKPRINIYRNHSDEEICPKKCRCWLSYYKSMILDCNGAYLYELPSKVPTEFWITKNVDHIELRLSHNNLCSVSSFAPWLKRQNLTKLSLASNKLNKLNDLVISPTLEILELHDNRLTNLDQYIIEKLNTVINLKQITLHDNHWSCSCDSKYFLQFLLTHKDKVPYVNDVICENFNRPLIDLSIDELCPYQKATIILGSLIVLLGASCNILIAIYQNYQQEVKVWMFAHKICLCLITEDEIDCDKPYDAFVSYSHLDESFITDHLVPELESGENPYRLCLHFRDWTAGEFIPRQITTSVENSRRTIVVLSPNYLQSVWAKMEFRTAHLKAIKEGRARVIMILLTEIENIDKLDPELKAYLTTNTYIKWEDSMFWRKLRYALPHSCKSIRNNQNV